MKSYIFIQVLIIASLIFLAGCNQKKAIPNSTASTPVAVPGQIAKTSAIAIAKAVGRWRLASILSGWTGKASAPTQNIELVINNQLQAVYYEEGKEVSRYQYVLKEFPSGIRYSITNQIGKPTLYMQLEGNFRVTDQQLIVGDTGVDGSDYIFNKYF